MRREIATSPIGGDGRGKMAKDRPLLRGHRVDNLHSSRRKEVRPMASRAPGRSYGHPFGLAIKAASSFHCWFCERKWRPLIVYTSFWIVAVIITWVISR
jgi:hypothetical protein